MPENQPPQRRSTDTPDAVTKMKDRTVATLFLVFSIAFLYEMYEVLKRHSAWGDFRQPDGAADLVLALLCGLIAIATAVGLDVQSLIKGFTRFRKE